VSWLGIHGHDALREAFARAAERGRLGHSYLFTGPEGVGKKRFALALAQAISCLHPQPGLIPCETCSACVQIKAGTYPDLHSVALPEGRQEFPIELMRDLIGSLGVKPSREGGRRVALVDDADALNEESANCFLKTLEEPPPDSLLILLGTAAERQLPTILSRCQVIRFQPLSQEDFVQAAVAAGVVATAAEAEQLAPLAHGSLSRAQLVQEADIQSFSAEVAKALQAPRLDSVGLGTAFTKFAEGAKDPAQKRERARFAVETLLHLIRAALRQSETGQLPVPSDPAVTRLAGLPMQALPAMMEACLDAEQQIDRRFQLALILEAFADRLHGALR
jgi:DNA polymerase-3 subunit delta'